ncbi:MAG TPA: sigma-54-dependent Fis family transcriptional regulator [Rhodothermales bacterium]|nr:sigma-54-dependent Fis family transcriptional regulator [Rhodothermales bacterium]
MNQLDTPELTLQALSEIALTINTIQEPSALLEKVLEIAMETLDAERGFVLITSDTEAEGFEITARRNFTEAQLGDIVRLSTSVVHEVLRSGEPVLVYEALEDDRFGGAESIVLQQIQSIACVPLRIKDRQIGAIYLDSLTRRSHFTRDNLPFLEAFANQAAIAIENAQLYQTLRDENRHLRTEIHRIHGFDEIIGQSTRMRDIFETMSRVADSDATVLIEGESGTGKELVARAIHYNGLRKHKPFVAIFCGSLSDELLESELFGHKKGAFTGAASDKAGLFEAADEGTVFLDEVGDLSPRLQTALLRVLQTGEIKRVGENHVRRVNVRIVSATNQPLKDLVKERTFREDLYYRLNTISITLPPLRLRRSDIPLLAHHFLDKYAVRSRSHIKGFTPDTIEALRQFSWPGNVRELENTIERAVVLSRGDLISKDDLRLPDHQSGEPFEPGMTLKDAERRLVMRTLDECDGNISETARVLDVSRRWLHYKLKEWETGDA